MKSPLTAIALFIFSHTSWAQDNLPPSASELVDKLVVFSEETRQNAELEIQAKEKQVAQILETHLLSETKSGNLKGAVAIQKVIDELSQRNAPAAEVMETASKSELLPTNEFDFFDHTWTYNEGVITFQLFKDGTGIKAFEGKPRNITWKRTEDGLIAVESPVGIEKLHFGHRDKDCYISSKPGDKRPLEILQEANKVE